MNTKSTGCSTGAHFGADLKKYCQKRIVKKGSEGSSVAALFTGQGLSLGVVNLGVAIPLYLCERSIYLEKQSLARSTTQVIARAKEVK